MEERTYLAIDLKSFYASVECVERGLDPMTANLVVADPSRTEKTICLAVSPSLKAYGIPGRPRLFEVIQKIRLINAERQGMPPVTFITAPPQMAKYMETSTKIYEIYLKYIAPEDIHVYSIDEVFMDITQYIRMYRLTARELARKIILDVLGTTGITATAGIGTNLYLSKVAMDVEAKHIPADENGVRIAELDEMSYRRKLWTHRPLTDFWRVGRGYARKLEDHGLYTMGDIARCSLGKPWEYYNEELLYRLFGINAQLLIDHAWGWEPCTIEDIKAYQPESRSIGSGQVLHCPYNSEKAKLVTYEMADQLALDLTEKRLVTDQLTLTVGYEKENLRNPGRKKPSAGSTDNGRYRRLVPHHAHGMIHLDTCTSSSRKITDAVRKLYDRIVEPELLVRRIYLTANHLADEAELMQKTQYRQMELFVDDEEEKQKDIRERRELKREKCVQEAMLAIKKKYGKNAVLKGSSLQEGAKAKERNNQIGGHKA